MSDPALAEIIHLVNADSSVHSLMSSYMVRSQYIGMQLSTDYLEHEYNHIACLVPPKVSTCYLQILASGFEGSVIARAYNMAGSSAGASVSISVPGESEVQAEFDQESFYLGRLAVAQTYSSTTPLVLRSSPTWDAEPIHIRFEEVGYVQLFGCYVQFIYKTV